MTRKSKDILLIVICLIVCVGAVIFFLDYYDKNKETVESAVVNTLSGVDEFGNEYTLDIYNEEKEFAILSVYMEESKENKWVYDSEDAEVNYAVYRDDHYVISLSPVSEQGEIVCALTPIEHDDLRENGSIEQYNAFIVSFKTNAEGVHDYEVQPAILKDEYQTEE